MNEKDFLDLCKHHIVEYVNDHLDKTDGVSITTDDVYMVWCSKVLQNNSAMLSTTLPDGMYYECNYSGDNNKLYVDAYKKFTNRCIKDVYASEIENIGMQLVMDENDLERQDVEFLWKCDYMQNMKFVLAHFSELYEFTYNGNKNELYVDHYSSWEEKSINLDE